MYFFPTTMISSIRNLFSMHTRRSLPHHIQPLREINLLVHTLGGYVIAYDSLVPADFNGTPAVGLDPVKMSRRATVEKLEGLWQRQSNADTSAQLLEQADRGAYSPVDRQWYAQHTRRIKRFMREGNAV